MIFGIIAAIFAIACNDGSSPTSATSPILEATSIVEATPASTVAPTATLEPTMPGSQPEPNPEPTIQIKLPVLKLQEVFGEVKFSRLTNLMQEGNRIFVTEQSGRIISIAGDAEAPQGTVFLDIRSQVNDAGNEEGLLGLAFSPSFQANGHLFVYYSAANPRRSVLSRFTVTSQNDQRAADPESEKTDLEIPQPFQNHNGGQLAFGPDGKLYISLGDGGSGGDPNGNGQNSATLLESILRIDVSSAEGYDVPPDNPFVGSRSAKGEVWAYRLKNILWRFSFDRQNGDLWTRDVGQNSFEEVNLIEKGGNYGWNILEGSHCYSPRPECDPSGTILPVIEYSSSRGCSVIGGYVYRGSAIPSLVGTYLYGDYCSGQVRGFKFEGEEAVGDSSLVDSGLNITSFGEDGDGEIYALSQDGGIYLLTPMLTSGAP